MIEVSRARGGQVMKLAVVIINWNAAEDTERCLLSVEAWAPSEELPSPSIWVVDNGSAGSGIEGLRVRHPEVRFVLSPVNRGFAGGSNLGIAAALAEGSGAVLLLNNDASLRDGDVVSMLEILSSDAGVGVVGPITWDGNRLLSAGGRDIARSGPTHIRPSQPPSVPVEVDYVPGTAVLIRREVFDAVGLLDEDYFFGGEMADLCARARQLGFRSLIDPRARASHALERSSALRETLHAYYVLRNRFLYIRKHHFARRRALYGLWTVRGVYSFAAAAARGRLRRARAIALGLADGLRGRFGGPNDRASS
jgi:GT2 family glycosyltransferase